MECVFRRKIENRIIRYFNDAEAPILVIEGARQVGKSFIIRSLCKKHYSHFVEINLMNDKENERIFENISDANDFFMVVQSISGQKLGDCGDTIIFLDEIQEYPYLLTMLKSLKNENRYRIIVSGSLLGVTLTKTSSIPIGSIEIVRMYPMDFEEFLWANGIDDRLISEIKKSVTDRTQISDGVHKRLLKLFKYYLICGGLPYCVGLFIGENDIVRLRDAQLNIYALYGDDASKYDRENKLHTKAIFDIIPSTIENKRKRMFVKDIDGSKSRFSDYEEDFDVLVNSGIVLEVKCCANPAFRLLESAKRNLLKLYFADVGLLTAVLFRYNVSPILNDDVKVNLGNVYECAAAMQLAANGHELFYADDKKIGEIDFLIDDYNSLSVKAIEIKSGKDFRKHNALDNVMKKYEGISDGIVLSGNGNIESVGKMTYLPIYALMFI